MFDSLQVCSDVLNGLLNLVVLVSEVECAEVDHCVLKHCDAGVDQNASEVGLQPHWVVYWRKNCLNTYIYYLLRNTYIELESDESGCDGQRASGCGRILVNPVGAVGDNDKDD